MDYSTYDLFLHKREKRVHVTNHSLQDTKFLVYISAEIPISCFVENIKNVK